MSDRPPVPTKTLIKRLRRLARKAERASWDSDHEQIVNAAENLLWQAAGRIEDLAEARKLLREFDTGDDPRIWDYFERTGGFE